MNAQLAAVRAKVAAPEIFSLRPRDDPDTPLYAALYRPDPALHGPGTYVRSKNDVTVLMLSCNGHAARWLTDSRVIHSCIYPFLQGRTRRWCRCTGARTCRR